MLKNKKISMHVLANMPHSHKKEYVSKLISKMDDSTSRSSVK